MRTSAICAIVFALTVIVHGRDSSETNWMEDSASATEGVQVQAMAHKIKGMYERAKLLQAEVYETQGYKVPEGKQLNLDEFLGKCKSCDEVGCAVERKTGKDKPAADVSKPKWLGAFKNKGKCKLFRDGALCLGLCGSTCCMDPIIAKAKGFLTTMGIGR